MCFPAVQRMEQFNMYYYNLNLTHHAKQRFCERLKIYDEAVMYDFAMSALSYGLDIHAFHANQYNYLASRRNVNGYPIVYQNIVFIFSQNQLCLITLYTLPDWWDYDYNLSTSKHSFIRQWINHIVTNIFPSKLGGLFYDEPKH